MAWACLRLVDRDGSTSGNAQFAGQIIKWYPEDVNGDPPHDWGGDDSRTWFGWVRVTGVPEAAQRATVRPDRRNGFRRRFYFDLATIENAVPPGQFRKWMQDTINPNTTMSRGQIKQRTLTWAQMLPFVFDRRTGAAAPDEQTILDWDPEILTGANFVLPPFWEAGDYYPATIPDADFPNRDAYWIWVRDADDASIPP